MPFPFLNNNTVVMAQEYNDYRYYSQYPTDDKKGKYILNWDGSKLTYDEIVERNQKCLEMERKGYLQNVDCTTFPLTQEGEKMIMDYIVQMAIYGYYQPKN